MERCIKPWEVNTQHPLFAKEWEEAEHGRQKKKKYVGIDPATGRPIANGSRSPQVRSSSQNRTESLENAHNRQLSYSTVSLGHNSTSATSSAPTSLASNGHSRTTSSSMTARTPIIHAPSTTTTTPSNNHNHNTTASASRSRAYFDSSPSLVHQQLNSQLGLLRVQMLSNTIRASAPSQSHPQFHTPSTTLPSVESSRPFNALRTSSSHSTNNNNSSTRRHWPPPSISLEPVKIQTRRTTKDGKVKVKIAVSEVRVDQCGICLEQFRVGTGTGVEDMAAVTSCKHIFHEACLKTWVLGGAHIAATANCPMCRASLISP